MTKKECMKKPRKMKQNKNSNKENELSDVSDIDDDDNMHDVTYAQSNATINCISSTIPLTNRPRRLAAESAHIKINLADYSW